MAVNKSFVVKNGLEVNTNLILADANTQKVGIGSTGPRTELDVRGGIAATDFYLSGIGTFVDELNVGTDGSVLTALGIGGSVGVGTAIPEYLLDIRSPVSTGQTALYIQGDVQITGDLSVDDITFDQADINTLNVTGFATIAQLGVIGLTTTANLRVSGVSTFNDYIDINDNVDISGSLNIGGATTLGGYVDINSSVDISTDLNVVGIATLATVDINAGDIEVSNVNTTDLNVVGIATLATVDINAGDIEVSNVNTTDLNVSGIATIATVDINAGDIEVSNVNTTDLNVSGIATISQLDVQTDFDVYASTSTFHNDVEITGDLTVNGTQTVINTQSLFVGDKDIILGIGTTPGDETDDSANGGGIAVASTEGSPLVCLQCTGINTFPGTYKQIIWNAAETFGVGTTDAWLFNYAVGIGSTLVPDGVRFAVRGIQFTDDTINTPNINVSGTSILDGVIISAGIVTASSGIVTYYGDGSNLTGLAATSSLQTVLNTGNTSTIGMSIVGVVTATSFVGDGSGLSGLTGVGIGSTGSINTVGIITASAFFGDGSGLTGVGIGSTGSTVFNDITTNQEFFPLFTDITTGIITASGISTSKLTYNPSTGTLTAIDLNSTSDINLKENVKTVENSLETISSLRGVSFDWKETGKSSYGVIAQELEEFLPELVKTGEVKSVNYNGLIGVLIEAIKELKNEVEKLKKTK